MNILFVYPEKPNEMRHAHPYEMRHDIIALLSLLYYGL